jgi:hypothetical protein
MTFFGTKAIDESQRGTQSRPSALRWNLGTIELPRVVKERQKQVKEQFHIGFTTHVTQKKLRHRIGQTTSKFVESFDGSCLRKQPLPISKWMRVFRTSSTNGPDSNMSDEDIGAKTLGHVAQINRGSIVDGASFQKKFASLVKPYAPSRNNTCSPRRFQVMSFEFEHSSSKIWTITDEADETSHVAPHVRFEPGFGAKGALSEGRFERPRGVCSADSAFRLWFALMSSRLLFWF